MSLTDLLKRLHLCHWEQICWMIDNDISNFNYQFKWRSPFTHQELVLNYIDLNQQVSRLLRLTFEYLYAVCSEWCKMIQNMQRDNTCGGPLYVTTIFRPRGLEYVAKLILDFQSVQYLDWSNPRLRGLPKRSPFLSTLCIWPWCLDPTPTGLDAWSM